MMPDYEKLYFYLFNRMTDVLECIEKNDYEQAKEIIIKAQQEAEELYMED